MITKIKIVVVESELESLLLEANYIKKFKPAFNIKLLNGVSYPLICITIKDRYPRVFITRQEDNRNLYFGPFPDTKAPRTVLKILRRIFPYQAVRNHPKKKCFYYHLHLCPCPPCFDSKEFRQEYKKTIKYIIQFLKGNKSKIIKELEKERDEKSKSEKYEEARTMQQKIDAINYVTSSIHKPFEYEINPNLRSDIRKKELECLRKELTEVGYELYSLERIECYDVSNIAGMFAVGSLVVFTNGEKDTSQYRRFKIKYNRNKPNDFAMMEEIISRRLSHKEWGSPNLIIVDGGKGQIHSALRAIRKYSMQIPIIGLAKKQETIITSEFKNINLLKSNDALLLLMRIRDEAHRFAITYHKKLRSRLTFS